MKLLPGQFGLSLVEVVAADARESQVILGMDRERMPKLDACAIDVALIYVVQSEIVVRNLVVKVLVDDMRPEKFVVLPSAIELSCLEAQPDKPDLPPYRPKPLAPQETGGSASTPNER